MLTLVDQMVVHCLNFDHLLALPTSRKHRTILPIVEINGILIEFFVVCAAEIARLFVEFRRLLLKLILSCLVVLELRLIELLLLLILGLLRLRLVLSATHGSLSSASSATSGSPSSGASWVDIRFNDWLLVAGRGSLSNIISTSVSLS